MMISRMGQIVIIKSSTEDAREFLDIIGRVCDTYNDVGEPRSLYITSEDIQFLGELSAGLVLGGI